MVSFPYPAPLFCCLAEGTRRRQGAENAFAAVPEAGNRTAIQPVFDRKGKEGIL